MKIGIMMKGGVRDEGFGLEMKGEVRGKGEG